MKNILGLIELTRPINLLFVVVAQILCAVFILDLEITTTIISLFVCTFLITAAGYVINDYFDVKTDALNKPKRVKIGRTVPRRQALLFVLLLNLSALIIALLVNKEIFFTYLIIIFLLWLYSYIFKRTLLLGNLLVAFLAAYSIYILDHFKEANNLLLAFTFFAFITNFIREIIKDCEDVEGDLAIKAKTLPIVLGLVKARYFISFLILIFLASIWHSFYRYNHFNLLFPSILITISAVITIYFYSQRYSKRTFAKASTSMKVLMLIGCLSIFML